MSILIKLQILLLLTGIGVTVYMFFLYKELRAFENEIVDIKKQVNTIKESIGAVCHIPAEVAQVSTQEQVQQHAEQIHYESEQQPTEDDDVDSVTSNEIKDILTNIQDDTDLQEQSIANNIPEVVTPIPSTNDDRDTIEKDLTLLSEAELNAMKYDEIRNFLRRKGYHAKGTKTEYINRILELGNQVVNS